MMFITTPLAPTRYRSQTWNAPWIFCLSFALVLLHSPASQAQNQPGNSLTQTIELTTTTESPGQALARRIRSSAPSESSAFKGQLKIRARKAPTKIVPLQFSIEVKEKVWSATYQTEEGPHGLAERLTILHSPTQPNQYFWASKSADQSLWPDPTMLNRDQLSRELAGSNFSIIDLGMDFLYWPEQQLIKTEMRKGRWCRVLESRLPQAAPGIYSRVISWLDKETGGPLLAEAYDSENKLLKEFSIGSFKKVDGAWQLEDMKISNVQTRSRTWIEFDLE